MEGQLCKEERKIIYETVRKYKPLYCIECGTWLGGGSTLSIGKALCENKSGRLFTFETNNSNWEQARNGMKNEYPEIYPYVFFCNSNFEDCFDIIKDEKIDLCMMDGPDDADFTVRCFNKINEKSKEGTIVIFHDWKVDKCAKIKTLIPNNWEKIYLNEKTTTGICSIIRR